jgi:diguanylate cyclase (GGDEF)-like protein
MSRMRNLTRICALAALAASCLPAAGAARPAPPAPIYTLARQVHDLPHAQAERALPVRLRARVTYYDPYIDRRHGALFVEDSSGGVFVALPSRPILPLRAGDQVEIVGVTGPGDYASVVIGRTVRRIGHPGLPRNARPASMGQLLSGVLDSQWIEFEGRVRAVRLKAHNVALEIATDGGIVSAASVRQAGANYDALVDALVRVHGVAAPVFNYHRQMVGVHVFFPNLEQVKVLEAAPDHPFAQPAEPIAALFRYSPDAKHDSRVHVRGRVTLSWPGRKICIEDAKDGICIQTAQPGRAALGALVDVLGFPAIKGLKPTLQDAVYRVAGPPVALAPARIPAARALLGDYDGRLVSVEGELIGQDFATPEATLVLRAGRFLFPAVLPRELLRRAAGKWKEGSKVRVTGICNVLLDPLNTSLGAGAVRPQSVQLLLRSASDVAVLETPSWWTARHTAYVFAAAVVLVLFASFWIVVLRKRVEQQTRALRRSEERLRHISEHDPLTGLPNRLLLNEQLRAALDRAARLKGCLGLLMIDADGFKQVNDALGHQAGDKLLCELAARLSASVRPTDTVARLGGDEFVVILLDLQIPSQAVSIANTIMQHISRPTEIDGARAAVTVSIGVATYPESALDMGTLIECADQAMYAAKARGKNVVQVYRPKVVVDRERTAPHCF